MAGNNENMVVCVNSHDASDIDVTVPLVQKLISEVVGTFLLIFAGCAAVVTNLNNDKVVTFPGVSIVWGLSVMVLAYSLRHISGAHFNPAVTLAHASINRFPWKEVPGYVVCQIIGSTLASGALRLIFSGKENHFAGTVPAGTDLQAFVMEFIITFFLMFVLSGITTDSRAIGELAGIAVGSTVVLNVLVAGPITGASMNPARSLGPAIVHNEYKGIWVYFAGPILGAVAGTWTYNFVRYTKSSSFLTGGNGKK